MIVYLSDPSGVTGRDIYKTNTYQTWNDQLCALFDNGLNPVYVDLLLNGVKIKPEEFNIHSKPKEDDVLTVINRPQGADPFSWVIYAVIAVVAAAASYYLASRYKVSTDTSSGKSSPNSSFTAQTNQARLYAQRPDMYGLVRSYPDLTGEAITQYNDNNRKVIQHWVIS